MNSLSINAIKVTHLSNIYLGFEFPKLTVEKQQSIPFLELKPKKQSSFKISKQ
jgi:hypothetical protein